MKNHIWAMGPDLGDWHSLSFWGGGGGAPVRLCSVFQAPAPHDSLDGTLEFCKPVGQGFKEGKD